VLERLLAAVKQLNTLVALTAVEAMCCGTPGLSECGGEIDVGLHVGGGDGGKKRVV